jgi:hypothetical protein
MNTEKIDKNTTNAWYSVAVVLRKQIAGTQTDSLITTMVVAKTDKSAIIKGLNGCLDLIYDGYTLISKASCRTDFEVKVSDVTD